MKGEATIGEYRLAYDFNAMCMAEEIIGPLGQAVQTMTEGSLLHVRALFWAGLQKNHKMSIEEAGEVIQSLGIMPVSTAVGEAITSAFGDVDEGNGVKAKSKTKK